MLVLVEDPYAGTAVVKRKNLLSEVCAVGRAKIRQRA